jgi:hypothetical protein
LVRHTGSISQDPSNTRASSGDLGRPDTREHKELLEQLARTFDEPEVAGIDWDLLRDGKLRAWGHDHPSAN